MRYSVEYAQSLELDRWYWRIGKLYCDYHESLANNAPDFDIKHRLTRAAEEGRRLRAEIETEPDPSRWLTDEEAEAWTHRIFDASDDPKDNYLHWSQWR